MWNPELSVEEVVDLTPPEPTIGTGGGTGLELDFPIVYFLLAHSLNFLGAKLFAFRRSDLRGVTPFFDVGVFDGTTEWSDVSCVVCPPPNLVASSSFC